MRIVVGGFLGLFPAGGVTWDYIQYVLGLKELGHDVWYVEDTGLWPVYHDANEAGVSCSVNIAHLAAAMDRFGLGDRWAYRDEVTGAWFGLSEHSARSVIANADMLINISCATAPRDEYQKIPLRVLIDSDPMFTQIQYRDSMALPDGAWGMRLTVACHTHHFSFGEKIGSPECRVPDVGVTWMPTRQPICTREWPVLALPAGKPRFTTVMNWSASKVLSFDNERWGQKDVEFAHYLNIPSIAPDATFAIAVSQSKNGSEPFPDAELRSAGWDVVDPLVEAGNSDDYRNFIQRSSGEFSVAKEAYVKGVTGWFSGRSASYLASGRPVITQNTGWSDIIPSGRGLFAFCDEDSAVAALEDVSADHDVHAAAAREIALEYFDSAEVLGSLIERART